MWLIIAAIPILLIIFFIKRIFAFIREHGAEIIVMRLALGRHPGHNPKSRHTNATFWKDSDGKTYGRPAGRVSPRHHRAGWKNLVRSVGYLMLTIAILYGVIVERFLTVSLLIVCGVVAIILWAIKKFRKVHTYIETKAMVNPLSVALSSMAALKEENMDDAITLKPDYLKITHGEVGTIKFPNTFEATKEQRKAVEFLVKSRFPYPVELKWKTSMDPEDKSETLVSVRIMVIPPLPRLVKFADYTSQIEKLDRGQYIIGPTREKKPFVLDHFGDRPMKAFSMNSGTGKSTMLGSIAAQVLGNDPTSELTGFDVKRISLEFLRGIPGVTIYSNPKNMDEMWAGWYKLREEMDRRYRLMQSGKQTEFPIHWIFLEEGNTFATILNGFYRNEKRQPGEGNTPPLWYDCVAQILWQGREVNMFVITVLQNFIERYFGNMSLRPAFGTIGMAGYKANQWTNIVQTTPVPVCQEGQGRICIVDGPRQEWVQGLLGSHSELRDYAMRGRKDRLKIVESDTVNDDEKPDDGTEEVA